MNTGLSELNRIENAIDAVLEQFDTPERLSDFEKGQADGLRWALDIIRAIKSPED